jgi:hypothetical protein
MKQTLFTLAALLLTPLATVHAADTFLVENGQARAEIVIAENPTRMQRVAAEEFRGDIERISGARLPIVTAPSGKMSAKVFIGRSAHTDALKVTEDGLQHGAYPCSRARKRCHV